MEAIKAIQKLKSRLHNYLVPQSIYMLCDEAIAELKALQQHKSCYDCKHWFPNKASYPCNQCSMAINCLFEPKEQ